MRVIQEDQERLNSTVHIRYITSIMKGGITY
jgi:hypothetical protein